MTPIQVFSPYFRTSEILSEIKECLDCGWTGLGFKTVEFEKAWEEYTGLPNCHFLSSNTVGLNLAFDILKRRNNWLDNDEVITTPLTFVSTNHAIIHNRLKPVFADVDEHLCLDPNSIKSRITPLTRAVIFVGLGGNTGRLDEVQKICKDNNLKLILDAAHMSGTYVNDKNPVHVGHEVDITIFSFQAVKNLPTADSGMICFKDKEDLAMATKLTWLGIDKDTFSRVSGGSYKWKYHVPYVGYKYHGNSIMASIGLVQLKYIDQDNDRRNSIADKYESAISGIGGISTIPKAKYCNKSSRHLYQILVNPSGQNEINKRDLLMEEFYNNDIFPGVHYIDNTNYPMYSYAENDCPNSKKFSDQLITLPIHLNLTDEDIERVLEVLSNWAEVNL